MKIATMHHGPRRWTSGAATLVMISTLIFAGCAHRVREVDSGKTADEVTAALSAALASSNSPDANFISSLQTQSDTTIFYFDGGTNPATNVASQLGEVDSVLAADFNSLVSGVTTDSLTYVQGYFVVHKNDDGHFDAALLIGYSQAAPTVAAPATGAPTDATAADGTNPSTSAPATATTPLQYVLYTSANAGGGTIAENEFSISLQSSNGAGINVSSYDLNSDTSDLAANIQLELWDNEGASIGQISSLQGF